MSVLPVDGYIRVSRVSGREGESFISPGEQRKAIEGWADLHGRNIGEIFEDLDESGKARHRPGLDRAMDRVIDGVSGGVVVAKLDRFGRSVPHLGELLAILDDHDAALYTVSEGLDTGGNTGRMIASILGAVAEFEVNRQSESWHVARKNAVERGVFVGGTVPIGYEKVDGRLVPGPDAEVVREVFRRRAAGEGWKSITEYLTSLTGRTWTVETVRYLVRNRTYLGEIHAGQGIVNLDAHDPLVDVDLFDAANIRKVVSRKSTGRATGLFSGLLRCSSCRYALRYSMGKTRHGQPRADYRCKAASRGAGGCPHPASVSASAIEPYLLEEFFARVQGAAGREVSSETEVGDAIVRVEEAEAELRALLDSELRNIVGKDSETFLQAVADRQSDLERARADLQTIRAGIATLPGVNLIDAWPDLTLDEQRSILSSVFEAIFIRPGGRVPDRVHICEIGEAPELPIRGRRWTPVEFRFPSATGPGLEDAA